MRVWSSNPLAFNCGAAPYSLQRATEAAKPFPTWESSKQPVSWLCGGAVLRGVGAPSCHSFPCKTGPDFAHNLMAVKYFTDQLGARVNFEKGNCYITKEGLGEKPKGKHIPFEDQKYGYALRIKRSAAGKSDD